MSYYLLYSLLFLTSLLPGRILKIKAKFFGWILLHIIKYRATVVMENLKKSFPKKPIGEIKIIQTKFYYFFADLIFETIKNFTITKSKATNSLIIKNTDLLKQLWEKHPTLIVVMGHYGNWETILPRLPLVLPEKIYALYKPLTNNSVDLLTLKNRSRFGLALIKMKETMRVLTKNKNEKKMVVFIGDQSPFPENAYWTTFLNQPTPVFMGSEKMAQKLNSPVLYMQVVRNQQGTHQINFKLISEKPQECTTGEITKKHTQMLESDIVKQPEFWLWSHRRWKHKLPENAHVN